MKLTHMIWFLVHLIMVNIVINLPDLCAPSEVKESSLMRWILLGTPNYIIVTGIQALIHAQKNLHLISDKI